MNRTATFGRKMGAGFAATVAFSVIIGVLAVYALQRVVSAKDQVITVNAQNLIEAQRLSTAAESSVASHRAFLLTGNESHLERLRAARADFSAGLARLRSHVASDEGRQLLEEIERAVATMVEAQDRAVVMRGPDGVSDDLVRFVDEQVTPKRRAAAERIDAYVTWEEKVLDQQQRVATAVASSATAQMIGIAVVGVLVAMAIAFLLTRTLTRQIGGAVQHVQSASAELQSAANQQATGTKEQVSAMTEITTTISELLATSRQIAESAQRVVHIADGTATAARAGDQTVQRAQGSIGGIKRQVDVIVNHMLDLGAKSQQIGGVLEIINELAEQTNILSINATIEAAGAGEAGARFAVVADEIRKLSDRVGGSTKEIRVLIDEVRAAVNATVMATEGGAKAVDAGTREFAEVTSSFQQIAGLVGTTSEAAREIELSTKQQATAVEQVNVAISNVTQAASSTETSAGQTLRTASELAALSRDLAQLIRPHATS